MTPPPAKEGSAERRLAAKPPSRDEVLRPRLRTAARHMGAEADRTKQVLCMRSHISVAVSLAKPLHLHGAIVALWIALALCQARHGAGGRRHMLRHAGRSRGALYVDRQGAQGRSEIKEHTQRGSARHARRPRLCLAWSHLVAKCFRVCPSAIAQVRARCKRSGATASTQSAWIPIVQQEQGVVWRPASRGKLAACRPPPQKCFRTPLRHRILEMPEI